MQDSTLGSVVPLVMFLTVDMFPFRSVLPGHGLISQTLLSVGSAGARSEQLAILLNFQLEDKVEGMHPLRLVARGGLEPS